MTKVPVSLRRSGGLATNLLHKLQLDLPFRTEFIIISAIFLLCFANVALVALSLRQLHTNVTQAVVGSLSESIEALGTGTFSTTTTSAIIQNNINDLREQNLIIVFSVSMIMTLLFGYLVVRAALTPTKAALAAQRQFIGNVTHELRTPLSIIKANSELLLMHERNHDEMRTLQSNIEEIDRIAGIIDNLLALSSFRRIDQIAFETVAVSECAHECIDTLSKLANQKQIALDAEITPNLFIWGNKSAVVQIFTNLIKNAIMYTPHEGTVHIDCGALFHNRIAFTVSDTGIGINANELTHIFEPFYQVEASRSKQRGSSGLGLAIVSDLVKLHRGKISIKSIPSKGTKVRVEFPALTATSRQSSSRKTPQHSGSEFTMDFSERG